MMKMIVDFHLRKTHHKGWGEKCQAMVWQVVYCERKLFFISIKKPFTKNRYFGPQNPSLHSHDNRHNHGNHHNSGDS